MNVQKLPAHRSKYPWLAATGALALTCLTACACSVPVFRYALDHWHADPFRLELPESVLNQPDATRLLRPLGIGAGANVELVPTSGAAESRLYRPGEKESPLWEGTLDEAAVSSMVSSPARSEIARRILEGHSFVWILVESADRAANDATASTLDKRLAFLKNVTELPFMDPTDPSNKLGPGPELRVEFSVLRVRNDDPAEALFLKVLAGAKADPELRNGPWLSAVFGRGRALGSWSAKDFGAEEVDEVSLFLLGACSCQVKNLNPGWDLLMGMDWDSELMKAQQSRLAHNGPTATPSGDETNGPAPETVTIVAETQPVAAQPPPETPSAPPPTWIWFTAIFLFLAGGAILWRRS